MGESCQDFEAASKCRILQLIIASYLVSVYLKVIDHLTLEFNIWMHMASLNSDFLKFRILKILNFHP